MTGLKCLTFGEIKSFFSFLRQCVCSTPSPSGVSRLADRSTYQSTGWKFKPLSSGESNIKCT